MEEEVFSIFFLQFAHNKSILRVVDVVVVYFIMVVFQLRVITATAPM